MTAPDLSALLDCLARHRADIAGLADVAQRLHAIDSPGTPDALAAVIELYERTAPLLERALWSEGADFEALLACYQALSREQDAWIRHAGIERHHFILGIPVADRPRHLRSCLESIYQVCRLFGYGGSAPGHFERIRVVVADDSREADNIRQHIELADAYTRKGLRVLHLGQDEQYALLQAVPQRQRELLGRLLTTQDREHFCLKGQAANRNLSYLKLLQLTQDRDNTLYYLVDSDQAFCVNRCTAAGEPAVHALNYFHHIDRIFRTTGTLMLTGKLVGDPPVSPAVMAANFLADVHAFFSALSATDAGTDCRFHAAPALPAGDAAYHDMAALFGFGNIPDSVPYRCRLHGDHDNAACLRDFAQRLNAFFFGEHLTRGTCFAYGNGCSELTPARTIYPGNYIVNYAGLKYIIPFGHLRLRMSGPTAGRLIQAEIGVRFASVNLPMLHRRTTGEELGAAFRPGVELAQERIDLSDEFERQFFGDLMLFSVVDLLEQADVTRPFEAEAVAAVIEHREADLLARYREKHAAILARNRRLHERVFDAGHWWLDDPALSAALDQVGTFIANIEHNFGEHSPAWRRIDSAGHRARRRDEITQALLNYRAERDAWDRLF